MKKIYSLVLMAAMLLIGTNAWAELTLTLGDAQSDADHQSLQAAINAVPDGGKATIILISNLQTTATAWIGTKNVGDAAKEITLDLNGNSYEYTGSKKIAIAVTHGTLEIKSTDGEGLLWTQQATTEELIRVSGTYEEINAKTSTPFAYLIVRDNVTLKSTKFNVLCVDVERVGEPAKWGGTNADIKYSCDFFKSAGSGWGLANGARIDVYGKVVSEEKYGIKVNGCVRYVKDYIEEGTTFKSPYPELRDDYAPKWNGANNNGKYEVTSTGSEYSPYVYIASTGHVSTNDTKAKAVAAYSSGFGRWRIEGYCGGSTGLYIKSGEVEVVDAVIESTNTESATPPTGQNSGVNAGGSAIVVESNAGYSGNISVVISGDTKVEGASGYAIEEVKTTAPTSEVTGVTIEGGTIVGGDAGAVIITDETKEEVAVVGGNFTGTIETTDGNTATEVEASDLVPDGTQVHTTEIVVDGKTTVVVSQGDGPSVAETKTSWATIVGFEEGSDACWTGTGDVDGVGTISGTVKLGELQVLSATAEAKQELTILDNATLIVDHLLMNSYAQIIVNAGGKLIVKGKQGITAPSVNNIILKTEEGKPAIFLFNPAVSSNRHPNATVEFISKSYRKSASDLAWQRFGIPTHGAVTEITAKYSSTDVATAFAKFNYESGAWDNIGFINQDGQPALNVEDLKSSFEYYQMLHNTPNMGTVVTMKGTLVGNDDPVLNVRGKSWNGFANSYMGPINGEQLIGMIPGTVDKAIYLYDVNANQATWESVTLIDMEDTEILPMQPFLIRNTKAAANATINYGNAVYYPTTGESPSPVPARRSALNDMTKVKLIVKGEDCIDRVTVAEGDQFSNEFDNGYDAAKYMNDGINMYVTSDEKMSIFATDNLENTYIGFQSIKGGAYSIEFAKVQGEELTLVDLETGTRVAMNEGNTYTFTADANTTNDYRFQIIRVKKVATDVESIEAQKNANGIYTVMGQYVGEMNLWNSLPAGVYVVDGKKLVK